MYKQSISEYIYDLYLYIMETAYTILVYTSMYVYTITY